MCGYTRIDKPVIENKSAYIDHWLGAINQKDDGEDWIVNACRKARQASNYIIESNASGLKKLVNLTLTGKDYPFPKIKSI